ncbi:retrovirus-related pol polyprotein from transposon TNT 1-94 [Tanacetum coccineum]|uniref:Retrovirus-related pol polyprotein from transposon TNT 1-94 n=1 Tax=Tanacetum coccineum TaxID=301880 RepID=A0ABQ4XSG3_9ASTR
MDDYDEVFTPIAKIEAIRLFLAYASFKDFMVYQMDVKSAFLYGKIKEEVYVCQPLGFEDPYFLDSVYKVEKALYGLHQAPKACQDKYVTEILKKFSFTDVKTTSTPMETQKPLLKDEDGEEVDVHLYRSMIGSLMYLTFHDPDIMYLKGQPKLGLWYLKDSSFDLVAYTDSDYAGASLDRKSITGDLLTKVFDATIKVKMVNEEQQLQVLVDGKKIVDTEASVRRDLQLDDEEAMVKNLDNAGKILMYPCQKGNIIISNNGGLSSRRNGVKGSAMPTDSYHTPIITQPHHLNLKGNKNLGGQRERTVRVIYLENTKTAQAQKITSLKKRVKKLEKKGGLRNHKLKRLYKVGLSARVESTDEASLGDQEDASK